MLPAQTHSKKSNLCLACVQYSVYTYINADMYATFKSLCIFRASEPNANENR